MALIYCPISLILITHLKTFVRVSSDEKEKKLGNGTFDDNKTMNGDESRYETRSSVDPANPEFSGLMKSLRKLLEKTSKMCL